jgi:hypothetical protein
LFSFAVTNFLTPRPFLICTLLNNVPHFFPTSKIYSQVSSETIAYFVTFSGRFVGGRFHSLRRQLSKLDTLSWNFFRSCLELKKSSEKLAVIKKIPPDRCGLLRLCIFGVIFNVCTNTVFLLSTILRVENTSTTHETFSANLFFSSKFVVLKSGEKINYSGDPHSDNS